MRNRMRQCFIAGSTGFPQAVMERIIRRPKVLRQRDDNDRQNPAAFNYCCWRYRSQDFFLMVGQVGDLSYTGKKSEREP
jgi:hypothetical protein